MTKILTPFLALLFLTGCSFLQPVKDEAARHLLDAAIPARTATASRPAVAIARPSLPPYLDREQLVTRSGSGQLEVHENQLWAEPLNSGMSRVISDNLRRLTGSTNIQPVENFITRDYTSLVEIRVEQFDPGPTGNLVFLCTWKVQPVEGGVAAARSFRTEISVLPGTTAVSSRIPAMNEALARLSRVIVKSL